MKKINIFGIAGASLLFGACSSDMPDVSGNGVSEIDQTLYVSMRIRGDVPDGTRGSADNGSPQDGDVDFAEGTENTVNNAYFVFYDAAGNVVGDIVPLELGTPESAAVGATVEKYYKSVVPVSVRKGENMPTQVICYINPISPSSLQNPLNVIQTRARDVVFTEGTGGAKYFAMSNSVYYPTETDGTAPQVACPIPEEILYTTESEAEAALIDEATSVNIYVERYASKLSFQYENVQDYLTGTRVYDATGAYEAVPVTLTFQPEYWAVNAESNTSYVIKSFRQESELGQIMADNYAYNVLNSRINPSDPTVIPGTTLGANDSWDWNNPLYKRSYWSVSPAYFTAEYPEVSQDVIDNPNRNQTYLTYNQLATAGFTADTTTPQYFKETTVGTKALNSDNPAAAVASVIFVGKYKISIDGTDVPDGTGFYTYLTGNVPGGTEDHPCVYFDHQANSVNSAVDGGGSMLKRFLAQATILFKATTAADGKVTYTRYSIANEADLVKLGSGLEVMEISESVKACVGSDDTDPLKLQSNARSLQFKSVGDANGIYIASGNGYKQIVADDATPTNSQIRISEANAILMQQVGYAYYFNAGEGYFNIPVKHLGWYRNGNAQKDNAKIDWNQVRVGDFGMVRNHSYSIKVNKITGLASGIGGNDIPIVPPANTTDYYVAYSVRILKWAVVPQQGVDL